MTTVYGIHVRVSTTMQAEDGDSIEMQKELAKELVEKHGGVIYRFYEEPALSATKNRLKDRPVFMELMRDIEEGKVNHVIAYRRDRLVRNTAESIFFRDTLKKTKCKVSLTARGEQPMDLSSIYSDLNENIRATLDEIESAQTSMRVSDTMISKAQRGEFSGGNAPYGYQVKDEKLIPIESEIDTIKNIEELYLEGFGVFTIVKWLNGEETKRLGSNPNPPERLKQHKRSSPFWTKEVVETILFNLTYSGFMSYKSYKNEDMEPIVVKSEYIKSIRAEERQLEINRMRKKKNNYKNRKTYNTPFLLKGLLYCAECGSDMIARTSQRVDGKRYSYYFCRKKDATNHLKCNSKSYKKEIIEGHVLQFSKEYVGDFISSDVYEIVKRNLDSAEKDIEKEIESTEKAIEKLNKDFQGLRRLLLDLDPEDDMYDMLRDTYQEDQKGVLTKMGELKKTKESLTEELGAQENNSVDIESIIQIAQDFGFGIDSAPPNIQKQLLHELFKEIKIDAKGNVTLAMAIDIQQKVKEGLVDFIQCGGVGDTTTPQDITLKLNDISGSSNMYGWLNSLIAAVKDTFYDYLVHLTQTDSKDELSRKTNISEQSIRHYRDKRAFPEYKTWEKLIRSTSASHKNYSKFLKSKGYDIEVKDLEIIIGEYHSGMFRNKELIP